MTEHDWRIRAACREVPPEGRYVFFPESRVGAGWLVREAKRVCARCPVVDECLAHAVDNYEVGVWGATSDEERQRIRRARRAAG